MDELYPVIREFMVVCITAFIDGLNIAINFWSGMDAYTQQPKDCNCNCSEPPSDMQQQEPAVDEL